MSESRLRLQHFIVQPVLVWDDGETLLPGPIVEPQVVALYGLRDIVETWDAKLQFLEEQARTEMASS